MQHLYMLSTGERHAVTFNPEEYTGEFIALFVSTASGEALRFTAHWAQLWLIKIHAFESFRNIKPNLESLVFIWWSSYVWFTQCMEPRFYQTEKIN